jgi:asparagine synthase (glutamine-hydrolysing)
MTNRADRSPIHMTTLDRVSMANGLEMRAIFFNDQIMRRSEIRQAVEKMIPKYIPTPLLKSCHEMVEPDISGWLRDPLKNWGGDFLHADQLQQQGFLNPARIQRLWDQHQSGKRDWSEILWRIIIFQNWLYVWR